ncbi:hypothetical protein BD410DRAFT_786738 [Rickenella mellea]|uniref:CHCH domain-containing protein n=1 Tax=Rickenella mellea TaxID=50990 RepID=A0A4Y7Q8V1_9AGAM|nr:hypothetical protein BD410DRAFT_786738 [Rickenella mellea]
MAEPPKSSPQPDPGDGRVPLNYREHFKGKDVVTRFIDPCEQAAKASMECMNRNDYNKEVCTDFFQAYRDCKRTWMDQRREDRRAGKPASIDIKN